MNMVKRSISRVVDSHTQLEESNWNYEGIVDFAANALVHEDTISIEDIKGKSAQEIKDYLNQRAEEVFEQRKHNLIVQNNYWNLKKSSSYELSIQSGPTTSMLWISCVNRLGYGLMDKTILVEYQTEGFNMFENMVGAIEYEVTALFMKAEIRQNVQREQVAQGKHKGRRSTCCLAPSFKNVGRNDPCPCGSGKKFKNCHGKNM